MKKIFGWFAILVLTVLHALAVTVTPTDYALAEPTYTGGGFTEMTVLATDSLLFLGVVVVIAILVTGFFKGRAWFKRV